MKITAPLIAAVSPLVAEMASASSLAAGQKTDTKNGPLLAIPTEAQVSLILSGAAGADEWKAYQGQIRAVVASATASGTPALATLSANLSALLAPVYRGLAVGSHWHVRMVKAHGKEAGKKMREGAQSRVSMFILSALRAPGLGLFAVANWTDGVVLAYVVPAALQTLPVAARDAGIKAADYSKAREAAVAFANKAYDAAMAKGKADASTDSEADGADDAAPKGKAVDKAPAMTLQDAVTTLASAIADRTLDQYDAKALVMLNGRLSAYLLERSMGEATNTHASQSASKAA